ncbi:hypothetical protein BO99DRAFT_249684 [Aspergillus violaceofuscus CBS 115571]|uniref:Uncharacterized protein n=1 Tax=Aspergillus violaceofuscus (strain CBS 115571) TaxID=1450538 RepID=A0A2V5HUH6_ASPV1|nr:hypothetical protein BO99DRAFT_249684 [Aspergillus violaceofuscus CBS 115571]
MSLRLFLRLFEAPRRPAISPEPLHYLCNNTHRLLLFSPPGATLSPLPLLPPGSTSRRSLLAVLDAFILGINARGRVEGNPTNEELTAQSDRRLEGNGCRPLVHSRRIYLRSQETRDKSRSPKHYLLYCMYLVEWAPRGRKNGSNNKQQACLKQPSTCKLPCSSQFYSFVA